MKAESEDDVMQCATLPSNTRDSSPVHSCTTTCCYERRSDGASP